MKQKVYNLTSYDGQYHNFFMTILPSLLRSGWVIKDMDINKDQQRGWVIMERVQ